MTKLLIQHGPAKGQKIDNALKKGNVDGVIFSPRDEKIDSIFEYINECKSLNKNNVFIDSQFYYSTYDKNLVKNLEGTLNFPLEVSRRDFRVNKERINKYFFEYKNYLLNKVNNILVPGLSINSIDWKFDYSIDTYKNFKSQKEFDNYYLTLVISAKMFHSKNDIDEILLDINDETQELDNKGIYLIINYDNSNDANYENIDAETLSNILYFIYMLKQKEFKIIIGYCFINSILFAALNCDYVGSGWFNNLRKFTNAKFETVDIFGRRKKKYFSTPLLSNINLENISELSKYFDINKLKSNTFCDDLAFSDANSVSFVDLEQQYWEGLSNLINKFNQIDRVENKIKNLKQSILDAIALSEEICNSIPDFVELKNIFKNNTSHLREWLFAVEMFTKKASILLY